MTEPLAKTQERRERAKHHHAFGFMLHQLIADGDISPEQADNLIYIYTLAWTPKHGRTRQVVDSIKHGLQLGRDRDLDGAIRNDQIRGKLLTPELQSCLEQGRLN